MNYGSSVLMEILDKGKEEIAEFLLENGAKVNFVSSTAMPQNALSIACTSKKCSPDIVKTLIAKGANLDGVKTTKWVGDFMLKIGVHSDVSDAMTVNVYRDKICELVKYEVLEPSLTLLDLAKQAKDILLLQFLKIGQIVSMIKHESLRKDCYWIEKDDMVFKLLKDNSMYKEFFVDCIKFSKSCSVERVLERVNDKQFSDLIPSKLVKFANSEIKTFLSIREASKTSPENLEKAQDNEDSDEHDSEGEEQEEVGFVGNINNSGDDFTGET